MVAVSPTPEVHIHPNAKQYIVEHGGHAYIRPSPQHGCCGGTANVPVVDLGRPQAVSDYRSVQSDGIIVHIHEEIVFSKSLVIGVGGFGRWKRLWVEGAEMTM